MQLTGGKGGTGTLAGLRDLFSSVVREDAGGNTSRPVGAKHQRSRSWPHTNLASRSQRQWQWQSGYEWQPSSSATWCAAGENRSRGR